MPVTLGIERLLGERVELIRGRRVGLISNASGISHDLTTNVEVLQRTPGVQLVALFGPEHGLNGAAADGAAVQSGRDGRTGVPVFSLYGEVRKPTTEMLAGIDVLIYDMQCVGARFYTYITTLLYAMQAAAEHALPFIVCDRPNPLGGEIIEGPVLERGFESFVGPGPLPIRYGLTLGELATLYNEAWGVGCQLSVVSCAGWQRSMWFGDTGLPWVPPSPAMPWPETAIVYPGTCLVEGTNLSEGRGTALPFHQVGAPWMDGKRLASRLNKLALRGVRFRPVVFQPVAGKWSGQRCEGVQLHVTDRRAFRAVTAGLHLVSAAKALYPEQFAYRPGAENGGRLHIDLLMGTAQGREALDAGVDVDVLIESWSDDLRAFSQMARMCRLYD